MNRSSVFLACVALLAACGGKKDDDAVKTETGSGSAAVAPKADLQGMLRTPLAPHKANIGTTAVVLDLPEGAVLSEGSQGATFTLTEDLRFELTLRPAPIATDELAKKQAAGGANVTTADQTSADSYMITVVTKTDFRVERCRNVAGGSACCVGVGTAKAAERGTLPATEFICGTLTVGSEPHPEPVESRKRKHRN